MNIMDIPTAMMNIEACVQNPYMNVISMDISEASPQMIQAILEKMQEYPEFTRTSGRYDRRRLVFERRS